MDSNEDQKKQVQEKLTAALEAALNDPVPVSPTCKISKSKYVAGMQCPKRLYLQVHRPDLGIISEEASAVMEQGTEVGILARKAFSGGVLVSADRDHLADAIRQTRELVDNPEVPAIFEATFEHHGVLVRVDVLERRGLAFRLVEVKSSTDVKPYHAHDLGIQKYVTEGCGIMVNETALMHLNREYVYDGDADHHGNRRYDLSRLFAFSPISPSTAACVSRELVQQFDALRRFQLPAVLPGRQCTDPYRCEFYSVCNPPLPERDVRALPIALWKVDMLRERGISTADDLPDAFTLRFVYHLTPKECLAAIAAKKHLMHIKSGLSLAVSTLSFPVCFLDFETYWPALPWYAGMRPYDHIPFQWSLHRQEHPSAPLEHFQFLWDQADDPRSYFAESLCGALADAGTIVVYNQSFESSRLKELAKWLPSYRTKLTSFRKKLWDLLPVVRKHLYHPGFQGSYSLKHVLPALLPHMGYEEMSIANGSQAGRSWQRLLHCSDERERRTIKDALSAYCSQDSVALACILRALQGLPAADVQISVRPTNHGRPFAEKALLQ